ncbi:hypothetical protein KJ596_04275 [Patescibacteria group bacterium]|nr:hypothetical protein [Patescibacteria group bacterium]MBU1868301.1 hypothetical protein [Patescibacteria group bacterium]
MKEKQIIDHVKNDLRRVAKWAGEIDKPFPKEKIDIFLRHAMKDFRSLPPKNTKRLEGSFMEVIQQERVGQDSLQRLRWAEKVLTLSCRL